MPFVDVIFIKLDVELWYELMFIQMHAKWSSDVTTIRKFTWYIIKISNTSVLNKLIRIHTNAQL